LQYGELGDRYDLRGELWYSNVTVISGPGPASPLSSPTNGATGQMSTLTLSWFSASGATSYTAQVSTGSIFFNDGIFSDGGAVCPQRQAACLFRENVYWRVGRHTGGTDWSSVWSFATLTVPAAPKLESPPNGAKYEYELDWDTVFTATFVYMSDFNNFQLWRVL